MRPIVSVSLPVVLWSFLVASCGFAQETPSSGHTPEFGVSAGVSRVSGHILGYRRDVYYQVLNLRYAMPIRHNEHSTIYASPEITPYARLDTPNYDSSNNVAPGRQHITGGGVSPIGLTADFFPHHRVEPIVRCNTGFIYFRDRVLSPGGSQFMYTVDAGLGLKVYTTNSSSTTLGFRYIHLSNANISDHNPGTDAETFYVEVARFGRR